LPTPFVAEEQDLDFCVDPLAEFKVIVGADFIQDIFMVELAADFRGQIIPAGSQRGRDLSA
jgi:hypothetical protein